MVCLLSRDHWRIGGEHEVDSRVRYQIGLELRDVDVESAIEAERSGPYQTAARLSCTTARLRSPQAIV